MLRDRAMLVFPFLDSLIAPAEVARNAGIV